ncbi:hypothetical protein [Rhodopirellula bahusiensis]|uniref:hypothetical protein n=1 Tax=Rhodopirellula bahusiensis TaxID=2014065 RepID=UPI003267470D
MKTCGDLDAGEVELESISTQGTPVPSVECGWSKFNICVTQYRIECLLRDPSEQEPYLSIAVDVPISDVPISLVALETYYHMVGLSIVSCSQSMPWVEVGSGPVGVSSVGRRWSNLGFETTQLSHAAEMAGVVLFRDAQSRQL